MRLSDVTYVQGRNRRRPATHKYGVAIHNTSNAQFASAEKEASYAARRTDGIGTHLFVDRVTVIQSMDTEDYCWHAGSSIGNHNAVSCEIVGTNNMSRQWWIDNVNWIKLGKALAQICQHYDIPVRRCTVAEMKRNPRVKGFYSHNDMRLAWGGTTHTDPGDNFPWDVLFRYVNMYLHPVEPIEEDDEVDAETKAAIMRIDQRLTTIFYGMEENTFPAEDNPMHGEENKLKAQLNAIELTLKEKGV